MKNSKSNLSATTKGKAPFEPAETLAEVPFVLFEIWELATRGKSAEIVPLIRSAIRVTQSAPDALANLPLVPTPTRWQFSNDVTIEVVEQLDGTQRFAIRRDGMELGKDGNWEMTPLPSDRDTQYLKAYRWDSMEEATLFVIANAASA